MNAATSVRAGTPETAPDDARVMVGRRVCKLAATRNRLTDAERTALDDALDWKGEERLALDLTRAGHPIAPSTIYRHRAGICICHRYATLTERPTP